MSFPIVKIGNVAEINPRIPKDIDEAQEVSFLGMASVSEDGKLLKEEFRTLAETRKGFTFFTNKDVLLAKITPCFENGKSLHAGQLSNSIGFGSTEFHVIRADPRHLDSTYLFYMVWSQDFRFYGQKAMSGAAGQKRISANFVRDYEIPLPPLPEQQRIAAILDKADAIRRKRQQAIQLADEFLRSVFLEMFGDPVTNPKGWEVKPVSVIANVTTGNTPPREDLNNYGSHIEWIKSDNINTPSHYLTISTEYLTEKGLSIGRSVNAGSILITCIAGSADCIGNVAISDRKVSFNQQINALTPKVESTTEYLYSLVLFGKKLIQSASTNSMKGMVSKGNLEKLLIPVPPVGLQEKYSTQFTSYMKKSHCLKESLKYTDDLFNALSQRAFAGEL